MWPFTIKIEVPELDYLHQYEEVGITDKMLIKRWKQLARKSGQSLKWTAAAMSLFNENILQLKDLKEMEGRYYKMAFILQRKGEDPFHLLKAAIICQLQLLKKEKFSSVQIIANGNCDACRKLDGKVMTIKSALKNMPIPIHEECQNKSDYDKYPACTCSYTGEADEAYLNRIV